MDIFARYLVDAFSQVYQYNYSGDLVRKVELPGIGTSSGFNGKETKKNYIFHSQIITHLEIYILSILQMVNIVFIGNLKLNSILIYIHQNKFFESKDGTKVPMIITHKGYSLNGKNPTILYGYGGFNISRTPGFSVTNAVWMDLGGVYAVPNIRGEENMEKNGIIQNKTK